MHLQHIILRRGKHGVETLQHDHRQDHVAVLAAHVEVAQHVVGDSPKEVGDPVDVLVVAHVTSVVLFMNSRIRHRCTSESLKL